MRVCHFCSENNDDDAIKCKYCQSELNGSAVDEHASRVSRNKVNSIAASTYDLNSVLVKLAKLIAAGLVALGFAGLIYFAFKLMGVASDRASHKTTTEAVGFNILKTEDSANNRAIALDGSSQTLERTQTVKESVWSKVKSAYSSTKNESNELKIPFSSTTTSTGPSISKTVASGELTGQNKNGVAVVSQVASKLSIYSLGHGKLWRPGTTINIAYIEGSLEQRTAIELSAVEWSRYANLAFDFESSKLNSDLRISFKPGDGNWSSIGTDAKNTDNSVATMNFDPSLEKNLDSTAVLQQFGRAIGLLQEQFNPHANIPWDKEAVYQAFSKPPKLWGRESIDQFLTKRWPVDSFPSGKPYDSNSVMHGSISSDLTLGNVGIEGGAEISTGDKEWVRVLYPE